MTRNCLLLFLSLLLSQFLSAQYLRLSGKITNNKLEALAFVSVKVKGLPAGTITKEDGTYELKLEEGEYELVISMVGFKPQVVSIVLRSNYVQNIILEPDEAQNLSEVIVRGKARDRSEEIIRQVIRHKEDLLAASGSYSCNVYIKATQEDSSVRKYKKNTSRLKDSLFRNNPNAPSKICRWPRFRCDMIMRPATG